MPREGLSLQARYIALSLPFPCSPCSPASHTGACQRGQTWCLRCRSSFYAHHIAIPEMIGAPEMHRRDDFNNCLVMRCALGDDQCALLSLDTHLIGIQAPKGP